MALYRINGLSGAGKSTVGRALESKGLYVVDADLRRGLSSWVERYTGRKVRRTPPPPLTEDWLRRHAWEWDPAAFDRIARRSRSRTTFFVGGACNQEAFEARFALEFALVAPYEVLCERLRERHPDRFVEGSRELEEIREWSVQFEALCWVACVIVIDPDSRPTRWSR